MCVLLLYVYKFFYKIMNIFFEEKLLKHIIGIRICTKRILFLITLYIYYKFLHFRNNINITERMKNNWY